MFLAANVSPMEWGLLAAILVLGGGVLWRSFTQKHAEGRPVGDTEENDRAQARAEGRIANLEVRLHDFAREVEARIETRALKLDSLVVAGDREIVRLSALLNQLSDSISPRQPDVMHFEQPPNAPGARPVATAPPPAMTGPSAVSPAQVEMVTHLDEAGYSLAEIAHIVGHPPEVVRTLLKKAA
jgi:hypothetical protein